MSVAHGDELQPDDDEAFRAARELVSRFESTPSRQEFGWVAAQVLDFKWGYLDGDLSRWRLEDVEEILLGLIPAKMVLESEDLDLVVKGFAEFFLFLGDEGVVPKSDSIRLATTVDQLAPAFHVEALDQGNWSMGERLWSQAQAEGVGPSDSDALRQFMDDFNQRPSAERDAVLGHILPETAPYHRDVVGPLPPITLPPISQLKSAARGTVWFNGSRRCGPCAIWATLFETQRKLLVRPFDTGSDCGTPVTRPPHFRTSFVDEGTDRL